MRREVTRGADLAVLPHRGEVPVATDRPRVVKGSGMAWQDLAVAAAAVRD